MIRENQLITDQQDETMTSKTTIRTIRLNDDCMELVKSNVYVY